VKKCGCLLVLSPVESGALNGIRVTAYVIALLEARGGHLEK
jgi:hypothetical protein